MNISDAARELLPCPFCGSDAEFVETYREFSVKCRDEESVGCDAGIRTEDWTKEGAKEIWNRRAFVVPTEQAATAALTLKLETVKRERDRLLETVRVQTEQIYQNAEERCQLRQQIAEANKERDEARSGWFFTCIHHTDAERKATPFVTCPVCARKMAQQLAEARADSRRLDLLSKLAEHRVELFRNAAGRITLYVKDAPTDDDFVQAFAPTVREAIDTALKALNAPTDEK